MTLIGAAVLPTSGQTWATAINTFGQTTNRPLPVRRCYDGAPPTSIAGGQLSKDLGQRASIYSIKPSMSTPLTTLQALAADMVAKQHPCDVIIYHEPVDNFPNPADYIALYQRCAPVFRDAGISTGVCFTNWSCNLPASDPKSALAHYWPGDDQVDFLAVDVYPDKGEIPPAGSTSTADALPMAERTRRVVQFADVRGLDLTIAEYGVDGPCDAFKGDRWLRSVTDWAEYRTSIGKPPRALCYYSIKDTAGAWDYRLDNHAEYVTAYTDSYRILSG